MNSDAMDQLNAFQDVDLSRTIQHKAPDNQVPKHRVVSRSSLKQTITARRQMPKNETSMDVH